jgi:outer membrane protein OmpA-like peptidoglycan-associated protein
MCCRSWRWGLSAGPSGTFFVPIYSNILIFAASILLAGDLPLKSSQAVFSLESEKFQSAHLGMRRPTLLPSTVFPNQQEPSARLQRSKAPHNVAQSAAVSTSDPPFLRHPILFEPNSLEPSAVGRNMLKHAATWLREHRDARVLIVGSCDPSGSENCTHALAEGRGAAIQKFLQTSGIDSDQLVGVKSWDNFDRTCDPADAKCQQSNRSVRIFMASSATPRERP